ALAAPGAASTARIAGALALGSAARRVHGAAVRRRLSDVLPPLGVRPRRLLLLVALGRMAHRARPSAVRHHRDHGGRGCSPGREPERAAAPPPRRAHASEPAGVHRPLPRAGRPELRATRAEPPARGASDARRRARAAERVPRRTPSAPRRARRTLVLAGERRRLRSWFDGGVVAARVGNAHAGLSPVLSPPRR